MSPTAVEELVHRVQDDTELVPLAAPFHFGEHGLTVNGGPKPTLADCADALRKVQRVAGAIRYCRGDLISYIEKVFKEEAAQVIDADLLDDKETRDDRFVAEHVLLPMRQKAPSWDHAKAIAGLPPAKQEKFLQAALDNDWIASKLKSEVQSDQVGGESKMRFLLIVDCGTEAKQTAVADRLEKEGYGVTKRSGVKKEAKATKAKAAKGKKEITARGKKRGVVKPYARRRK